MKIYYKFLVLVFWGLLAGGCGTQSPAHQPDKTFTLKTALVEGKMAYVGVGGKIDGLVNPNLTAQTADTVRVVIVNGDNVPHDFAIPELNIQSSMVMSIENSTEVIFEAKESMDYSYFCDVPGHRQAGMEGKLLIEPEMPK